MHNSELQPHKIRDPVKFGRVEGSLITKTSPTGNEAQHNFDHNGRENPWEDSHSDDVVRVGPIPQHFEVQCVIARQRDALREHVDDKWKNGPPETGPLCAMFGGRDCDYSVWARRGHGRSWVVARGNGIGINRWGICVRVPRGILESIDLSSCPRTNPESQLSSRLASFRESPVT